ncbi:hypothetical protein ACFCWT_13370 [Streptomyces olivaceus]|uniref:hypothetical protein n=1 Tax=Streptomyces olivaceus TaxID=47716 RepID=UPI0035E1D27B
MPKFRKKPVEIEAVQWDGTAEGATPIIDWILSRDVTATYRCSNPERCAEHDGDTPHSIVIRTLEGDMSATVDDWIIRGVQGEFYPCKPDIFAATYEAVASASATTEAAELEKTASILSNIRVFAGLHRSAEDTVTRVITLHEQWVAAGPPPPGASLARWWDKRLAQLHNAIQPDATTEK